MPEFVSHPFQQRFLFTSVYINGFVDVFFLLLETCPLDHPLPLSLHHGTGGGKTSPDHVLPFQYGLNHALVLFLREVDIKCRVWPRAEQKSDFLDRPI